MASKLLNEIGNDNKMLQHSKIKSKNSTDIFNLPNHQIMNNSNDIFDEFKLLPEQTFQNNTSIKTVNN